MSENSNVEHVTDDTFESVVIKSDLPVLVDFWAPWCAPCQFVGPIIEEVANEYAGRAKVVKVNVDQEQAIASSLGIRSIPTIAIYSRGQFKDVIVGARPKGDLVRMLDKALEEREN
jgi:thioredoxin 1